MDTLKTIVGHHVSNLFLDNVSLDNVSFVIAKFLKLSKVEIAGRATEK